MRMSRASAYAIGAVLYLADAPQGEPIPCSMIAKAGEMPERFLLQILRVLVNHGILRSTRGVEGGYSLLRPLTKVTLLDIMEAVDGPLAPEFPPLNNIHEKSKTRLEDVLRKINAESCQSMARVRMSEFHVPRPVKDRPKKEKNKKTKSRKRASR